MFSHVLANFHTCDDECFLQIKVGLNSIWNHSTYGMRDWLRENLATFVKYAAGERNLLSIFMQYFLWYKRYGQHVTIPFRVIYECKAWSVLYDWDRLESNFRTIMEM